MLNTPHTYKALFINKQLIDFYYWYNKTHPTVSMRISSSKVKWLLNYIVLSKCSMFLLVDRTFFKKIKAVWGMNVELLVNKCRHTVEGSEPLHWNVLKTRDVTKSHAAKRVTISTRGRKGRMKSSSNVLGASLRQTLPLPSRQTRQTASDGHLPGFKLSAHHDATFNVTEREIIVITGTKKNGTANSHCWLGSAQLSLNVAERSAPPLGSRPAQQVAAVVHGGQHQAQHGDVAECSAHSFLGIWARKENVSSFSVWFFLELIFLTPSFTSSWVAACVHLSTDNPDHPQSAGSTLHMPDKQVNVRLSRITGNSCQSSKCWIKSKR